VDDTLQNNFLHLVTKDTAMVQISRETWSKAVSLRRYLEALAVNNAGVLHLGPRAFE